ncbi:MAG: class I SAM-dependent methyltransferase [Clostridia bacterium]|nr:class I SAM-dependent methyltransferase [Clostridia bacterium]
MDSSILHRAHKFVRIGTDTIKDIIVNGFTSTRRCPMCGKALRIYWPYGVMLRPGAQCPHCRGLERHRTLYMYFEKHDLFDKENMSLLHFAPEKAFIDLFSSKKNIDYWPVDINPNMPGIRRTADITDIPFEDESMDVIICNHVMEHIPDEGKALREMYRVLKKGGIAVINVPLDENRAETFENPEYNTPELRLKYFGQHDHVRIYGRDYEKRLGKVFTVEKAKPNEKMTPKELSDYGVWSGDTLYLCRK